MTPLTVERWPNGLELVVDAFAGPPLACAMIWYRCGSAEERDGRRGAAHLLEHLMFKGTERFGPGDIDRLTQRAGGSNNAFTDHDYTAYYFALPGDGWRLALELEADRMHAARLADDDFAAEREVVLQELRGELDSPWGKLEQQLHAAAFRNHPYRHPVLGWADDLAAMTAGDLRQYYESHYHPANATIVVSGRVEPAAVVDEVERRFGALSGGARPSPHQAEPAAEQERRVELIDPGVGVARLEVLYRTVPRSHPDHAALRVAEIALAEGKRGRLYRRLVDGGLARVAGAFAEGKRDDGLLWLWVELVEGADPRLVEDALHAEVARLAVEHLGDDELQRARRQLETGYLFGRERASDRATALGRARVLAGDVHAAERLRSALRAVDAEAVRDAARRHLQPSKRCVGLRRP